MRIGLLHPGLMGESIGASAQSAENVQVLWAGEGRSEGTRQRAARHGFEDCDTIANLVAASDLIVSVCPPHAAEDVARQVLGLGYSGLYLDGNAISPQRSRKIGSLLATNKISYVDGGIVGPPAWKGGTTWLHLSGPRAQEISNIFAESVLIANVLGDEIGAASGLKMCFAAYTKGVTSLLCGILATAHQLNVSEALIQQWADKGNGLDTNAPHNVREVTQKAWRFVGEMEEISATFKHAGLPGEFHQAAADIYRRISGFKGAEELPDLQTVLEALIDGNEDESKVRTALGE